MSQTDPKTLKKLGSYEPRKGALQALPSSKIWDDFMMQDDNGRLIDVLIVNSLV